MATDDVESAGLRSGLRWYQFSLRGLLLFTLFVAILLSILSVGWTVRFYEARVIVVRDPGTFSVISSPACIQFRYAVQDATIELASSDSVVEAVTQTLQQSAIHEIDGEKVEANVVRRHVVVNENAYLVNIIASSSAPEISKAIAATYFKTWFARMPVVKPTAMQEYLERAKVKEYGFSLDGFESDWRCLEQRLQSNEIGRLFPGEQPMSFYFQLLGDARDPAYVKAIYPYWNSCVKIAIAWFGIGSVAFGVNRWRCYRAYRGSSRAKTSGWPIGPEEDAGSQTDSRAAPLAGQTDAPSEHTFTADAMPT